jgi:hypothetical protein
MDANCRNIVHPKNRPASGPERRGNEVARKFRIVFDLSDEVLDVYRPLGHALEDANGESGNFERPRPRSSGRNDWPSVSALYIRSVARRYARRWGQCSAPVPTAAV